MMFHSNRLMSDNAFSYRVLKIVSFLVMITSIAIFIYFLIAGNFYVHYIITTGCLFLLFCGIFMWQVSYIAVTERSSELTFEKVAKQVKRFGWLSLGSFYGGGICFYAGLILLGQQSDTWRYSVVLFAASVAGLVISMYGLIQRKITKQHYELKKQLQEMIDLLSELKSRELKDNSGVLVA